MNKIPDAVIDDLFERQACAVQIEQALAEMFAPTDSPIGMGIFLSGCSKIGKTTFVLSLLDRLGYDAIRYDTCDIRNKTSFRKIDWCRSSAQSARRTYMTKFFGRKSSSDGVGSKDQRQHCPISNKEKNVIVVDDVNNMCDDMSAIFSLIRPKRVAKQSRKRKRINGSEFDGEGNSNDNGNSNDDDTNALRTAAATATEVTKTPIIFIGSATPNKKIKSLINVCRSFILPTPTAAQTAEYVRLRTGANLSVCADLAAAAGPNLQQCNILCNLCVGFSSDHAGMSAQLQQYLAVCVSPLNVFRENSRARESGDESDGE